MTTASAFSAEGSQGMTGREYAVTDSALHAWYQRHDPYLQVCCCGQAHRLRQGRHGKASRDAQAAKHDVWHKGSASRLAQIYKPWCCYSSQRSSLVTSCPPSATHTPYRCPTLELVTHCKCESL